MGTPSLFLFFLGLQVQHMEVPRLGVELQLQLPAYTTAHGNAGFFNPMRKARIEPESSWILVGFVTTELQWELPSCCFFNLLVTQIAAALGRMGKARHVTFFFLTAERILNYFLET